jgi:flagellar hook-associated protein 3 FlgL
MRITNRMITTRYTKSLNNLAYELDRLNNQVATGRKHTNSSENTAEAVKAFQIRRNMSKVEGYLSNIEYAKDFLTNSETGLTHLQDVIQEAKAKILTGINDTQSKNEREVIATELRDLMIQFIQTLNTNVSGRYIFGGTNTETPPFEVVDGKLHYNGHELDSLEAGTDDYNKLLNDSLTIDIGLGIYFNPDSSVNKSSVFGYSITGVDIIGSGTTNIDGTEVSNNIYDLIKQIADQFDSDDYSHGKVDALLGHFEKVSGNVLKKTTEVGSKTSYLDFMKKRYDDQIFNLKERQVSVEGIDTAYSIIMYESQKLAYNAALQMGARIIQPSIFNFMS